MTQACSLDAMEGGDAVARDGDAGGELSVDEVTLGMSPGGNVSWETDDMNLGREGRGRGGRRRGGVVISDMVEDVGKDGAPGEGVMGRDRMMVGRPVKGCMVDWSRCQKRETGQD